MAKKDLMFFESAYMNNRTYQQYYNRLTELSVSMFEWKNVPDTIDLRYLELCLFAYGQVAFFKDEVGYIALPCMSTGVYDIYNRPVSLQAFAANGFRRDLTIDDSVIIYNNCLRTPSKIDVEMFAKRLYNIDRTIDVNVNAQKTPVLVLCDENERLTLVNMYKQYEGNAPFIFGKKGLNRDAIKALSTGAPYISDKLTELKNGIWNEALTYLGISNVTFNKKERLVSDEVARNMGGVIASRFSRLNARQQAAEQINNMFGLDISVEYREEYDTTGAGPETGERGENGNQ